MNKVTRITLFLLFTLLISVSCTRERKVQKNSASGEYALIVKNNTSEGFEDDISTSQENIRRLAGIPLLSVPGEKPK